MPRDGSGIYTYPPGTPGIPDTTIPSAKYNGYIADIQQDLNLPRPIVAGGTGATNATAARDNLDAERSAQQVTNYDTHVFEAGSFFSNPGATGEPAAGKYTSGICHFVAANSSMVLEARVYDGGNPLERWSRVKWVTWAPWTHDEATADSRYVNVTGDTMTGNLVITATSPAEPVFRLDRNITTSWTRAIIQGTTNSLPRWWIVPSNSTSETGGDAGSDFQIDRFNDAGTYLGTPLTISRATGATTLTGSSGLTSSVAYPGFSLVLRDTTSTYVKNIRVGSSGSLEIVNHANSGVLLVLTDGGALSTYGSLASNGITSNNDVTTSRSASPTTGVLYFGTANGGSKYLFYNGTNFILDGGSLSAPWGFSATGDAGFGITVPSGNARYKSTVTGVRDWNFGTVSDGQFWIIDESAGALGRMKFDTGGNITIPYGTGYKPGGGPWADSSDIRIKNILGTYEHGLKELKDIAPVRYTYKANHTMSDPALLTGGLTDGGRSTEKEYVGVVAQDIEKVMPETVTTKEGWIDGKKVDDLRIYDSNAVIYALVNAVKELSARIEALEAAQATP